MVDMETYKAMHDDEEEEVSPDRVELEDDRMNAEEPPAGPFTLLLPARIRGYGFHNKKWSKYITP